MKYLNTLPPVPFESKFLKCPLEEDRYTKYKETSLEKNFKWDLVADIDVGVCLDLIDMQAYTVPHNPPKLEATDAKLCAPVTTEKVSKLAPAAIPWLRKPQYLANDYSETVAPVVKQVAPEASEEVTYEDYLK